MKQTPKILFSLCLALLALLLLGACSGEPEEHAGYILADNPGADYDFYYPETWLVDRMDAGLASVHAADNDFTNVNVTAIALSGGSYTSLADYAESFYFKEYEAYFQNLEVKKNEDGSYRISPLKVDGTHDAVSFEYTSKFGEETYSFRTYLISDGINLYNFTYTANVTERDLFSQHLSEAEQMVAYLHFR